MRPEKLNSDQSAFPILDNEQNSLSEGLTKREYFAAMAMQGICASGLEKYLVNDGYVCANPLTEDAIRIADELLKQLEK
jgi:hypothetical protein